MLGGGGQGSAVVHSGVACGLVQNCAELWGVGGGIVAYTNILGPVIFFM